MVQTNNLAMTLVEQNQAQKAVTVNEALMRIDAILNNGAIDKDLSTPPVSPAEGDLYIVADGATGDWASHDNKITYFNQIWRFISPNEGMILWVNDENKIYTWGGSSWVTAGSGALSDLSDVVVIAPVVYDVIQHNGTGFVNSNVIDNISQLGVNTSPDVVNKFAVSSDAVLFNTATGDAQIKVNKTAAVNTGSYLFQTNWSGRAEFGTIGDDDFQLKVSTDGSSFYQSFVVDSATGNVDFKQNVFIGGTFSGFLAEFNEQLGVSYTLVASDSGKVITATNAAAITVTLPNDLPKGFNVTIVQGGAGAITLSVAVGAVMNNRQAHTSSAGQHGIVTLVVTANSDGTSAVYNLAGDTT